jgi:hypothetical protein
MTEHRAVGIAERRGSNWFPHSSLRGKRADEMPRWMRNVRRMRRKWIILAVLVDE